MSMPTSGIVRPDHPFEATQSVLDAAVVLLRVRQEAIGPSGRAGSEIAATGDHLERWTIEQSQTWRELLSTRCTTSAEDLRASMPNNRVQLERGLLMRSCFDRGGTAPAAARLLVDEDRPDVYMMTTAPIHLKIVDRERVLMSGPVGSRSILQLGAPRDVDAAMHYWGECLRFATPCSSEQDSGHPAGLTSRQRLVLDLLVDGSTDTAVAHTMNVSRRTVQSEVTEAMSAFGVTSRFALGIVYAALREGHPGQPPAPSS